jgi:hypothetical protein
MPAKKKRTRELVERLYEDVFVRKMSLCDAAIKNDIGKSAARKALKEDAVYYGFITREQHDEYLRSAPSRGLKVRTKNFTEPELLLMYSNMGIKSASNGLKEDEKGLVRLVEQARKVGTKTQENHGKKVGKNLNNARHYGSTSCCYENIWFDSQGERMTALLLKSYGLLENIISGENFQKSFGRFRVDFFIKDSLIVEYHPIPKQDFSRTIDDIYESTAETYKTKRIEQLKPYFNDSIETKVVVISATSGKFSATEFYNKLNDLGIKDEWYNFLERYRKVKKDIEVADKQYLKDVMNANKFEDPPF